ncbi:germination protein YpeB [Virgibacillus dokdonensis]|uniref:Germination protein YpeB n=1 Tax=Virgibacillus dokdonensis TaxID=302167 RepID=A0A2K9J374_9BACI|nr:germination protein YpeB [Virgibacillus dokdonensis]AUJ26389.1 Sporulation protein YpeB [Virgibacillus dokdonensis]
MIRWILIAVLAIGVIGTGFWGYQEHQEKNAVLIQAENTYQRAFHDLTYRVDVLNDKIGSALAMNSNQQLSPQLVEIWRITSEALSDVGQLPLGLLPFNKTEEFLADIGEFTYRTAVRDLKKEPLSAQETKALEKLYKQSGEIKDELRKVQHTTLENNLRWMDVQLALANEDQQMDNTIIDGFKTVEKKVDGFTEGGGNASTSNKTVRDHEFKFLTGNQMTKENALTKASNLLGVKDKDKLRITESGKGAEVPVYSISYQNGEESGYLDLSQKGGHPFTLLINRPIKQKKISLNAAMRKAEKYLKKNQFEDMTVFQSAQYGDIGAFSFLYNKAGIRYYSDALEVKVALDNGEILGLTAIDYFMNHGDREKVEPKISVDEAREMVNPNVDIQEEYLAVIDNDLGEEVLTYEFLGTMGNETYRIFINAIDGREEQIEKLSGSEVNYARG